VKEWRQVLKWMDGYDGQSKSQKKPTDQPIWCSHKLPGCCLEDASLFPPSFWPFFNSSVIIAFCFGYRADYDGIKVFKQAPLFSFHFSHYDH
jgi:hypothetical protein